MLFKFELLLRVPSWHFPQHLLRWVWDWFQKADKNKDGKMTFKEVRKLLKMMNVDMNEEHALHLFTVSEYCCFSVEKIFVSVCVWWGLKSVDHVVQPKISNSLNSATGNAKIKLCLYFHRWLTSPRVAPWKSSSLSTSIRC